MLIRKWNLLEWWAN